MRGGTTKYLLKRTLRGHLPDSLLSRRKQGFGVPLESWFSGSIRGFFREQLEDGRRLAEIGIPRAGVRTLQESFEQTGRRDYCDRLWSLVVLDRSIQRLFGAST
jgi:asparagine synthase (glutamine-hydrolysing)